MKPFRLILPFLFLSSLLGGEELFWWFKVQGANPWLKSAIPYILFRDCPQKERFLLGYNFPGAEESVKLSERVSLGYMLQTAQESGMEGLTTGSMEQSTEGGVTLKIVRYDIKSLKEETRLLRASSLKELITQLSPSSPPETEELNIMGTALCKSADDRLSFLRQSLEGISITPNLKRFYIEALLEEEEYDELATFLETPVGPEEIRAKIFALMELGNTGDALKLLGEISPATPIDLSNSSICRLSLQGPTDDGEELLRRASRESHDWRISYNFALYLLKRGKREEARNALVTSLQEGGYNTVQGGLLKEITQLPPPQPSSEALFHFPASELMDNLLKEFFSPPETGKTSFKNLLREEPGKGADRYFLDLGLSEIKKDRRELALGYLRRGLVSLPFHDSLHGYIAYLLFLTGKNQEALRSIETALFLKPSFSYNLLRLGILKKLGLKEEAARLADYLRQFSPYASSVQEVEQTGIFPPGELEKEPYLMR